jgi:hypothetical protein
MMQDDEGFVLIFGRKRILSDWDGSSPACGEEWNALKRPWDSSPRMKKGGSYRGADGIGVLGAGKNLLTVRWDIDSVEAGRRA